MKKQLMLKLIGGLLMLSTIISLQASWWFIHQPETPDILR